MKPKSLPLLAALAIGSLAPANAQVTTTPVGYETITLQKNAFNYIGIRLHENVLVSGDMSATSATTVRDVGADFSALTGASTFYILEVTSGTGNGTICEFTGANVASDVITIPDDLRSLGTFNYNIRKAATLSSLFGANNSAGLNPGFSSVAGADIVYVPNGSGAFDKYYYMSRFSSWANATTNSLVNGANVPLVYSDGVIISASSSAPTSITVSGEVKTRRTQATLISGFNYISTLAPAGATLSNLFVPSEFTPGFTSPAGADIVYVPKASGGFDKYYYSSRFSGWANADTNTLLSPLDGSGLNISGSGLILSVSSNKNITLKVPTSYSTE